MSLETTSDQNVRDEGAIGDADRPSNVVFFDGVCGLCNYFVDFILSRDRRRTIRFSPLQGETAARWIPDPESQLSTVVWLDRDGRTFVRSAAAIRVLRQLGGVWSFLAALLWIVPLPLRDLGYRIIAANRYRLFARKAACRLPTPEERSRFLP